MKSLFLYSSLLFLLVSGCDKGAEKKSKASTALGEELYRTKACSACHSVDGSPGLAPTFKGLLGRRVDFNQGPSLIADEAYIRESIKEPGAKITKGYPAVMPKLNLPDEEVESLILFIKSLGAKEKAIQN